jgi:hypothetical protein
MYHHELPTPEHPAKRSRPRDITKLYVHKAEWADMQAIRSAHGSNQIIGVEKFPVTSMPLSLRYCVTTHPLLLLFLRRGSPTVKPAHTVLSSRDHQSHLIATDPLPLVLRLEAGARTSSPG